MISSRTEFFNSAKWDILTEFILAGDSIGTGIDNWNLARPLQEGNFDSSWKISMLVKINVIQSLNLKGCE